MNFKDYYHEIIEKKIPLGIRGLSKLDVAIKEQES